jgi:hypothetical protein
MNLLQEIPIQHVGYLVKDRKTACEQLKRTYGLDNWTLVEYKPMKASCYGRPFEEYYVKAAVHPPAGGCGIEIIQPVSEGLHMDFFRRDKNAINHICHTVRNYQKYLQHFLDRGCELVFEAEMEDEIRGYRRCGYVYDPVLRTLFEFAEIPYFRNKKL